MRPLPQRLASRVAPWLAVALATVLLTAAAPARAASALSTIKADNAKVQALTKEKPPAGSAAATHQEAALKDLAIRVLDLPTMAQASLGKSWSTLSAAQKSQFSDTFSELVKDNYVNQIRGSTGYTITYGSVSSKGTDTVVDTTVKLTRNGHTDESDVQYVMRLVGADWKVEDIVTDDESMIEDYRGEFGVIIKDKGFDALEKRLQARVAKLKAAQ